MLVVFVLVLLGGFLKGHDMSKRKINIGGGNLWFKEGWEILDNAPVEYGKPWQHQGKCWNSGLSDNTYDIVFSSHMLEHVPHFRLEKTIAEFNRIMKDDGVLRILVPSLRQAAEAYIKNDASFFSGSKHYSDHMGIGASFLRLLISPGGQTLAVTREMDEIIGGYAHLYAYDFEMLRAVLEKWGFGNIRECAPGQSTIEEMRDFQHVVCEGERHAVNDPFVREKRYLQNGRTAYYSGFDKPSMTQLVVEAKKISSVTYAFEREYQFNQTARYNDPINQLKLALIRYVCRSVDLSYAAAKHIGVTRLVKRLLQGRRTNRSHA